MSPPGPRTFLPKARRRWLAGGAVVAALGATWGARDRLADHVIAGQLAAIRVPGQYRIVSIAPGRQELADLVLGDPAHPDLTARRLVLHTGLSGVTGIELDGARVYGRVVGGRLSFGSLDWWLAQPSAPLRLPDWEAALRDARLSIGGEWGNLGLALTGSGNLANGFSGHLAGRAPLLEARHCRAEAVRLDGQIATRAGQAALAGDLLATALACKGAGLALASPRLALVARGPGGGRIDWRLTSGRVALAGMAARAGQGVGWLGQDGGRLGGDYRLGLDALAGAGLVARQVTTGGHLTGASGAVEAQGTLAASGLAPAPRTLAALDQARAGMADTMLAPLLDQLAAALRGPARAGDLAADYALVRAGGGARLDLPRLALKAPSGALLAEGSGFSLGPDGAMGGRLALDGPLPALRARFDPRPGGTRATFSLAHPLRAGGSILALPALRADWNGRALALAGRAELSGAFPGGRVERLELPLAGRWSARGGLVLGTRCQQVGFGGLSAGKLALAPGRMALCPDGPALLAGGRLAARVPALALDGRLDGESLALTTGPLRLSGAGLAGERLEARLGGGAARYSLGHFEAHFGAQPGGRFAGGAAAGGDVPVVLSDISGAWHREGRRLVVDGLAARLADQTPPPGALARFNPLELANGRAVLDEGRIAARGVLRHPASGRVLAELSADHALAARAGGVRIRVPGLLFDPALQPAMLSPMAEGIAENVAGVVHGSGRIDWAGGQLTSSGAFETSALDLAAAFGPARGIAGRVEFTDLLGLVTAPGQQLRIAMINPGIEADDGVLRFAIAPGHLLRIEGAEWPFLSGQLRLRPTTMTLGAREVRRYVLEAEGIDAGEFLQRMDLPNLGATGHFDGVLPLVFDADGGRAEGGQLVSRDPGGNVSYVGALSYKDLSPMANYAFQTLRSLDYRRMRIGIDGSLAGEVVTRVSIEGVSQGRMARRNFLTRQLARLPIRFNINVRGNFYEVIQSMAATYDPLALCRLLQNRMGAAERTRIGLATDCGKVTPNPNPAQPPVQHPSSEHRP